MKLVMNHPTRFLYQTASQKVIFRLFFVERWLNGAVQNSLPVETIKTHKSPSSMLADS